MKDKEPILRITPKKYTGETTIVSVRIQKDMLSQIDSVAELTGRTRNELILKCINFALDHMEVEDK